MAADRVIAVRVGTALTFVAVAWPVSALAQLSFIVPSGDLPTPFAGAIFRYQVSYNDLSFPADQIELRLWDYLELIDVLAPDGQSLFPAGLSVCDAGAAGPPYVCAEVSCGSAQGCLGDEWLIDTYEDGGGQVVRWASVLPAGNSRLDVSWLRVRLRSGTLCSDAQANARRPSTTALTVTNNALTALCASPPVLAALTANPVTGSAPRGGGAISFVLSGQVIAPGDAIVTVDPRDPSLFTEILQCAQGGGAYGACAGGPFAAFATIVLTSTSPFGFSIQAVDQPRPPAGDVTVRVSLAALTKTTHSSELLIPVVVEQPATSLSSSVARGGVTLVPPIQARPGERLALTIDQVRNALGAHEPPSGIWRVVSATYDDAQPSPDTSVWLAAGPTTLEPTDLLLPADLLANGSPGLTLTLVPSHPNPVGPALDGTPVVVAVAGEPVTPRSCRIEAQRDFVAEQSWTGLRLVSVTTGGQSTIVGEPVVWSVSPATVGTVQPTIGAADGYAYHLLPADPLPPVAEVTIGATSDACDERPAPVTLALRRLVSVRLSADRQRLDPGMPVRLRAAFTNLSGAPLEGLRVRWRLDGRLATARRRPPSARGVQVHALSRPLAEVDETDAPARRTASEFGVDLAVAGGELELLSLARAGAAPGPAIVRLEVFSSAALAVPGTALSPLAEAQLRLFVQTDPELEEATLVGKVFVDGDGDGSQGHDEPGLGGVMIAVAAGMYARTDSEGRYHLARLAAGRHAVKLNPATLPLGAKLTTAVHREVTLTPGGLVRVNFGVSLPELERPPLTLIGERSGLALDGADLVYRAVLGPVAGRTLVARLAEREWRATISGEQATLLLPVDERTAIWTLVEQAADGRTWLYTFALLGYARPEASSLVIPIGPRLLGGLVLPGAEQQTRAAELVIAGQTHAAGNLTLGTAADRRRCELSQGPDSAGARWRCVMPLRAPLGEIIAYVDPAPADGLDAPAQGLAFPVRAEPGEHFLVALGGVSIGAVLHGEGWDTDGGGAFFYRGRTAGGMQLTAGADAWARDVLRSPDGRRRTLGGIGSALLGHDPRRVFRDLDPEAFFPVYGDESVTVDERESGGRFFVRVQDGDNYVKWGGLNTAIDDAEVGRFVRSLYGLGGVWQLGATEDLWQLGVRGFAAQPESAGARDELIATGGSLYFLSHRYLVEGSVRLTLETLDEISGLPIQAVPLIEGSDYEVDHAGGRVVLQQAIAYRVFGRSLTGGESGGHRQRLIAEYEYLPGLAGTRDWSLGGKLSSRFGPFTLGATAVTELAGLGEGVASLERRYSLVAGSARLDLGESLRLRAELARSEGRSHAGARSRDGGLSYTVAAGGVASGEAAVLELTTGFGGVETGLYGRLTTAGFADSRTAPGQRLVQGGLRLGARLSSQTRLWANYDHREARWRAAGSPLQVRDLGLVGVTQALGPLELSAEGRYEHQAKAELSRTLLGLEATYALSPGLALSARRRQRVMANGSATRETGGESAVGVRLVDRGAWQLLAEAGLSDTAEPFARAQGGLFLDDETELYAGLVVGSHLATDTAAAEAHAAQSLVAGGRRQLDGGVSLYSEQGLRLDGGERLLTRAVGGQIALAKRVTLSLGYERGTIDEEDGNAAVSARDAGNLAIAFVGDRLTARLAVDGWLDERGGGRRSSLGSQARIDLRATEALTLAVAGRGASAMRGAAFAAGRRAWEGAVGFALRPVSHDRLNLFGRHALVYERDEEATGVSLATVSQVSSLAAVFEVAAPFAVGPRLAYRHTRLADGAARLTDQALLGALRADLHLAEGWDVGVEGRLCTAPGSGLNTRVGALSELSLLVWEWLRLGAGYNFSEISAAGVRCEEPGARGLFLRAEAVY